MFDSQGIPGSCQSDNGPPFQSKELRRYARRQGFTLRHITPEWPRANGEVERFNRTMKEAVQKGSLENRTIRETAGSFMRSYRATPHTVTMVSPFEAMYQRRMKVDLPMDAEAGHLVDRAKVDAAQKKMIVRRGQEHTLEEGDTVLIRQRKKNKLTPSYDSEPLDVTDVKGSMVTAQRRKGRPVTRDGSWFKKVQDPTSGGAQAEEHDDNASSDDSGEDHNEVEPRRSERVRGMPPVDYRE